MSKASRQARRHARKTEWVPSEWLLGPDEHVVRRIGTYYGTCVACMRPTDSGLAFTGKPWQFLSGLIKLGLSENQALRTLAASATDNRTLHTLQNNEESTMPVQVCTTCAEAAGMSAALSADGLTVYTMSAQNPLLVEAIDWIAANPERDIFHP